MISIRTRLTLIFSLTIVSILSLIGIVVYWATLNLLYKADYEFLSDEVGTIQYLVESQALDMNALHDAIVVAPSSPDSLIYHYYGRIYDEKNALMIETPGSDKVFDYPSQAFTYRTNKKYYTWVDKNNIHYLILRSPIKFGRSGKWGMVEIAVDVTYQYHIFQNRKLFIGIVFASIISALLIGFMIAHRGVRSLYLLTEKVKRISATSLNQRIDPRSWPRELSGLVNAFNQMLEGLEASFVRLKQFSSDLSHEMRTPITNMIGQTEVSLSYATSIDEYRSVLESNLEELQRISSLIENILFLARAENPQIDLHKVRLEVSSEIELISDYFRAIADEKEIKIISDGDAYLNANQVMFRRLMSNLISNAIKFSKCNGTVHINTEEINDMIQISVKDDGIGMDSQHLPHIFDRFYRVESAKQPNVHGTGLGLAIVKSIVEMHRGSLQVHSQYGKGTVITICLPKRLPTIEG